MVAKLVLVGRHRVGNQRFDRDLIQRFELHQRAVCVAAGGAAQFVEGRRDNVSIDSERHDDAR